MSSWSPIAQTAQACVAQHGQAAGLLMEASCKASGIVRDGPGWHLRPLNVSRTRESGFLFQAGVGLLLTVDPKVPAPNTWRPVCHSGE